MKTYDSLEDFAIEAHADLDARKRHAVAEYLARLGLNALEVASVIELMDASDHWDAVNREHLAATLADMRATLLADAAPPRAVH